MSTVTLEALERLSTQLGGKPRRAENRRGAQPQRDSRPELPLDLLQSVLGFISAHTPRGDGSLLERDGSPAEGQWLGTVWAARRDWGEEAKSILRDWSKSSDRFTEDGFNQAWNQFDPAHPNPVTSKSLFRLAESFGWVMPEPSAEAGRYQLLDRDSIMALPPIEWRVKGTFPKTGIAAIYGASGSGKSFIGLDMGIRITRGEEWFGRKTVACPVTYVMLEGEAGLRNRIAAWEKGNGAQKIPPTFFALPQGFSFAEQQDVKDLADTVPEAGVIIVDTFNRATSGKDENSSKDMSDVLRGMKQLQEATKSLVLFVHHTGKDASKGMRGHSSLHAALDSAIEVKRDGDRREWSIAKSKDGSDDLKVAFNLNIANLGSDDDGANITSCFVSPDVEAIFRKKEPKGTNQIKALRALNETGEKQFSEQDVYEILSKVFISKTLSANNQKISRALLSLVETGHIKRENPFYRITASHHTPL